MATSKWPIKVEPSILAADFGHLAQEAKRAQDAGADALHIDIMDGQFVRNLSLGPRAVAAINRATSLFLDVHLMIYNPFDYVEHFVEAGADRIIIHFEATEDVVETLAYIRKCNVEAGLAFSPDTSDSFIPKFLNLADLILVMTVHPGFGGQSFLSEMVAKVAFTRTLCEQSDVRKGNGAPLDIQVDGGIDEKTARRCIEAGANVVVSGTYLFGAPDMRKAIEQLKSFA